MVALWAEMTSMEISPKGKRRYHGKTGEGPHTRTFRSTELQAAGVTQWLEHALSMYNRPALIS